MEQPKRVLTVGETMVLFDPHENGAPALGSDFKLRIAGAESNFAIGLARLGVQAVWVSRLGPDPFGDIIYRTIAAENVDLRFTGRDEHASTGTFFKWRDDARTRVFYYRKGSAASLMTPDVVPDEAFFGVDHVHLTGITLALSASSRETTIDVARRAAARGIPVTFDPNYRPALWDDPEQAATAQSELCRLATWYLCGLEEGIQLHGGNTAEELIERIEAAGATNAVVRVGAKGAMLRKGNEIVAVAPSGIAPVVDEVGAGDAFAAGFTYGLLRGWGPAECTSAGNLIAATALAGSGDWETLPHLDEIAHLLEPAEP